MSQIALLSGVLLQEISGQAIWATVLMSPYSDIFQYKFISSKRLDLI